MSAFRLFGLCPTVMSSRSRLVHPGVSLIFARFCRRFQEQLKKLAPGGQSDVASALGKAFDMLGQHRFRTGVDTW